MYRGYDQRQRAFIIDTSIYGCMLVMLRRLLPFRGEYGGKLPEAVLERLTAQGVARPNELQRKCLAPLLDGGYQAAVVNAETGSGKTLCFLFPILKLFADLSTAGGRVPSPSSLVLVPTPHLSYQIQSVYQSLAEPSWGSCVAHHRARLLVTSTTSLVITTPTTLTQYPLSRVLRHVQLLCVDEADILLTGSEREATWTILNTIRNMPRDGTSMKSHQTTSVGSAKSMDTEIDTSERRFIFTAATLPSGGRQTAYSQLERWLPKNTLFFKTGSTHKLLSTAELTFIDVNPGLTTSTPTETTACNSKVAKQQQLIHDLHELHSNQSQPKILVFCNSVSSAESLFTFLTKRHTNSPNLCTLTPSHPSWWTNRVGRLYNREETTPTDHQETLRRFRQGGLDMLVCSDLGCRGLDLPNVTAVIQYDFPGNVAEFIHRAGRTARAGKTGHVISYIGEKGRELANEIRDATEGGETMDGLFSRNKMLRRRLKRRTAAQETTPHLC